jgi:tyrosyl-DNA phosphodiesterase-1
MFSPATPVIIVTHPATENMDPSMLFIQQNWIRITPRLLYNYSCMHMKVRAGTLDPSYSQYPPNDICAVHVGGIEYMSAAGSHADFFHSQLFNKSGRLRIAITTANLVPLDWRDIENVGSKQKSSISRPMTYLRRMHALDRLGARCLLTFHANPKRFPSAGFSKPS